MSDMTEVPAYTLSTGLHTLSDDEVRFLRHIIHQSNTRESWEQRRQKTPAPELYALARAIQEAFAGRGDGLLALDAECIEYLAACTSCVLESWGEGCGAGGVFGLKHDHVFQKALRGFISAARQAILENQVWEKEDVTHLGALPLPAGFVAEVKASKPPQPFNGAF